MSGLAPARRYFGPVAPRLIRYRRPGSISFAPQRRCISAEEKPLPTKDTAGKGPNQDQLPHVSEEAAAIGKITGEGGPELDKATPVQEMLKRDKDGAKNAPQVLKDAIKSSSPSGSRSFSTTSRSRDTATELISSSHSSAYPPMAVPTQAAAVPGLKFDPPRVLGPQDNHKTRYPEAISRATRLLMRDGKLAKAQTDMARVLNILRTSSPPTVNPERPLHPDSPPASQLPLNPVLYFVTAIDSIAPLLRLQGMKGFAGGGQSLQIPKPLTIWQRRRQAMVWILEAVNKKKSRGSGPDQFARKVAEELISIVEGKSSLWERRQALHRLSTAARANLIKVERIRAMR